MINSKRLQGLAEVAARELLADFCKQHAEEQRQAPHGFHQGHVERAAKVIVKWLGPEVDDGH